MPQVAQSAPYRPARCMRELKKPANPSTARRAPGYRMLEVRPGSDWSVECPRANVACLRHSAGTAQRRDERSWRHTASPRAPPKGIRQACRNDSQICFLKHHEWVPSSIGFQDDYASAAAEVKADRLKTAAGD